MPNKRKKNKKLIGGWLEDTEVDAFKSVCEKLGVSATDLLSTLIREEITRQLGKFPDAKDNNQDNK